MKTLNPFKTFKFPLLLAFVALLVSACEKEEDVDYTYGCGTCEDANTVAEVLKNNAPEAQFFNVDAGALIDVEGEQGTRITIGPNSFADMDGNPVSGNIDLILKEIYTPGQMILANKMTTSNGQILSSGGELFFNVQQNGEDLQLINNQTVSMKVPASNPDPNMALFNGSQDTAGNFTWAPNNTPVQSCNDSSSVSFPTGYCFNIDTLFQWINCDYFWSDPRPLTDVEIVVPQGYDKTNTLVFIYVPSINSIASITQYQNQSFWIQGGYRLPVGLEVDFVAVYSDGNGTLGYAYQTNTIVANHQEVLQFTTVTEQQLTQFLLSL